MSVAYLTWITRDMLKAQPEARFVFGDNRERVGLGGQAGAMRGEPNAIGVATLYAPGFYYVPDDPLALSTVASDLHRVSLALAEGRKVFVPADGLGTGLARLPEHAPALHRLIVAFFRAAPGEPCPWKDD
ncbi:hypothetical protein [Nitratireductor pacificus]|uniref:DUF7831 domain-containing protein n=1 Tax=Nitratireductor pacificus pht-3B TaxID=391937 RepID=K2M825_9HYPH|nr:hypothetical protein [Nitratireductor pacificus]EKF17100.1 hypothetical protein NA2_20058 [Nitratireductor pacificus pht-3B]